MPTFFCVVGFCQRVLKYFFKLSDISVLQEKFTVAKILETGVFLKDVNVKNSMMNDITSSNHKFVSNWFLLQTIVPSHLVGLKKHAATEVLK